MDEIELIKAARQNDLEAFNQLVWKYQDMLYRHAYHLIQNKDLAEDITQDAFITAFQKLYQFRDGSFRAWLLRIVTNNCYDEMRSWKRMDFVSLEPLNYDNDTYESPYWIRDTHILPEESAEINDLRSILESALSSLPFQYRNAVALVDIQQMNYQEAAVAMGTSIGTLKSRLARGRVMLRGLITNNAATLVPTRFTGATI